MPGGGYLASAIIIISIVAARIPSLLVVPLASYTTGTSCLPSPIPVQRTSYYHTYMLEPIEPVEEHANLEEDSGADYWVNFSLDRVAWEGLKEEDSDRQFVSIGN